MELSSDSYRHTLLRGDQHVVSFNHAARYNIGDSTNNTSKRTALNNSRILSVKRRSVSGHQLRLDMESGESLLTRRFAPVSPGNILTQTQDALFLQLGDLSDVQISPPWTQTFPVRVGDLPIDVVVKEIESQSELDGFLRLTKYHYRGARRAGRTVPLIATASHDELPDVLGFIELSSSFLVSSSRQKVLNSAFSDPERRIGWARWDGQTARKWINCIARISRCVVFPELRGLGLSTLLVESAVQYGRDRWHIGGMRPAFLEITADMLRYWPFVEKSGFIYVGDTEGNEHRAARDMSYLIRKAAASPGKGPEGMPRGGGGILSFQRSRATHLRDILDRTSLSVKDVIDYLKISPDRLSDEEWHLLHNVYRRPKPTYLRGLTQAAEDFLSRRSAITKGNGHRVTKQVFKRPVTTGPLISLRGLTITTKARPVSSSRSRRLQEAFGFVSEVIEMPIIEELDLNLHQGEIILVTGPSGSGKSVLLKAIQLLVGFDCPETSFSSIRVSGRIEGNVPEVGCPKMCDPDVAPIDALDWLSMETALQMMAVAGLAEPQVLVRPAKTLSLGQRYRLSLALGLSNNIDVLLVDEFCEPLDQFSTAAVARHLRRETDSRGIGAVVATSRADLVASSLRPDQTLSLSSDGGFTWR